MIFSDAMKQLLEEVKRIENKSIPLNKDLDLTGKHAWNASSWARDHVILAEHLTRELREKFGLSSGADREIQTAIGLTNKLREVSSERKKARL